MAHSVDIEHLLPIYKVEHHTLLSFQGDVTVAFEASLPEIFTLSGEDYDTLHHTWVKALRLLPPHTVFHKQDWYTQTRFQGDFSRDGASFLSEASERFFQGMPFLRHRCRLFITGRAPGRKAGSSLFCNLLRPSLIPRHLSSPHFLQEFQDRVGQCCQVLVDSGFLQVRQLQDEELVGTPTEAGILEQYCFLLDRQCPPFLQDLRLKNELHIGDKACQLFTLADAEDFPSHCGARTDYAKYSTDKTRFSLGFSHPLGLLLPCDHVYNQYVFLQDTPALLKKLESKRLRLQSLAAYSRENAIARDATHAFLQEAIADQRLPVKAHFNLLAWTDDPTEGKALKNMVSAALAQMDATPKLETVGAPQLFWAGLPGNEGDFPMNETIDMFLEQAACFFTLESGYRSTGGAVGIRLGDRVSGTPVQVDLSDEPMRKGIITNRNKFILGPSGSGKSFFTNHMVRSYHEQGTHVVVVDVGHSYQGLCELVGGYYFTYGEAQPLCFNPFYIQDGDSLDTEKKESIKTLLLALWKKEDETYGRSEYVALSHALQGYYERLKADPSLFPCFDTFYEYLSGEFLQVLEQDKVKEKDFDVTNFLYVLKPYYKGGEFDFLLNATRNLDLLGERFIVFELDTIKEHPILFPVVTIIIMEVFISKMRKLKGIRKMILIEEAWKAIAKEGMAEYIRYLFKTVRKFYGEAVVVTQEVEDIISSPVVKQAILSNSDCKILLDQAKYQNKFDQVQELLGLTEKEKTQVLSLNKANDPTRKYKEVFISLGGRVSQVYRTEVSLEEYLTYTTEESEKLEVQRKAARHGGMAQGVVALADEIRKNLHNK
ncbi:TraG family conjugative transposon ATPase [Rufibacter sp. LB8]|uniref:TraG family conjugative transposon ATPase n=1 Tax=Rufibacter sp. LB8 TaxID=2777781 RepID=UPI00178C5E52|nr:TraG family conjugative transposon ATPase [Rufibacter sp. LB8]